MPSEMEQFAVSGTRKPLTEVQKNDIIENLQLELSNRIERLKSQYQFAAQGVRAKVEIRKTRIPKRYWNKTLRELQSGTATTQQQSSYNSHHQTYPASSLLNFGSSFNNMPKFTIPHDMNSYDLDSRLASSKVSKITKAASPAKTQTLRSPMRPAAPLSPVKSRPATRAAAAKAGSTATQSTASARAKVEKPELKTRTTRSQALKARQALKTTN